MRITESPRRNRSIFSSPKLLAFGQRSERRAYSPCTLPGLSTMAYSTPNPTTTRAIEKTAAVPAQLDPGDKRQGGQQHQCQEGEIENPFNYNSWEYFPKGERGAQPDHQRAGDFTQPEREDLIEQVADPHCREGLRERSLLLHQRPPGHRAGDKCQQQHHQRQPPPARASPAQRLRTVACRSICQTSTATHAALTIIPGSIWRKVWSFFCSPVSDSVIT